MKSHILNICTLTALSCLAVQGQDVQNLVKNGDFEEGEGPAFYQTMPWYNRGTGANQGTSARSSETAVINGSYSAIVSDRYSDEKLGPIAHVQRTEHVIEAGDSFSISYRWRPGDKYWQTGRDTIRLVLYATGDNKVGSPVVWSQAFTSGFFRGRLESPMEVAETSEEVNPDAVGKTLLVGFHGLDTVDGESGSAHWARVDDIVVTVKKNKPAP